MIPKTANYRKAKGEECRCSECEHALNPNIPFLECRKYQTITHTRWNYHRVSRRNTCDHAERRTP